MWDMWGVAGLPFACEYKSWATLPSSVTIKPLVPFDALKIALYQ